MPAFVIVSASALLAGCASPAPAASDLRKEDLKGLSRSTRPAAAPAARGEPVATIDGAPVMWEEIGPLLAEAAGGVVLRDLALDRALAAECLARGVHVSEADIEAERALLLDSIEREALLPGPDSGVLLDSIRRARGLGESRFVGLLGRNARLRALVRNSIDVTPAEVDQAMQIRFGQRYRVRVIVTETERAAQQFRQALLKDAATLDVSFARTATLESVDPSSVRGGLLEPISPFDQTYPDALRSIVGTLEPGVMSPVIAVDDRFALVLLDETVPASAPPDGAAEAARAQVRLRKERLAMEDLAQQLMSRVRVEPLTPAMEWSWKAAATPR